jgi:hypothetical protein
MATKQLHYARRSFRYADTELSRGQIFELRGFINDEKLTRLGYCEPLPAKSDTFECRGCDGKFIGGAERDAHYRAAHLERNLSPNDADALVERREKLENTVAPLYLDKTAASRGVNANA